MKRKQKRAPSRLSRVQYKAAVHELIGSGLIVCTSGTCQRRSKTDPPSSQNAEVILIPLRPLPVSQMAAGLSFAPPSVCPSSGSSLR